MNKAGHLSFDTYSLDPDKKTLRFRYTLAGASDETFEEIIILPDPVPFGIPESLLDAVLFNMHLMLGISYYKLTAPQTIKILTRPLFKQQVDFWNTVYRKGLGEYAFRNNLDIEKLVDFPFIEGPVNQPRRITGSGKSLVGIGGGKDSLLTAELLKKGGRNFDVLVIETNKPYPFVENLVRNTGGRAIIIKRLIDPKLSAFAKKEGFYDGHIPISAVYAFIGLLTAVLYGYEYFIVSNEQSANYGNVAYKGTLVNHQWSKSLEFEKLFDGYVKTFIHPGFTYFSLLRPMWEIEISRRFTAYPGYFKSFSSCNKNFSSSHKGESGSLWCGSCAKCAFAFAMLAAFTDKDTVTGIFGKNLYANEQLIPLFRQLFGHAGFKPFDCVGTPEEVKAAFLLAHKKSDYDNDSIMKLFIDEVLPGLSQPDLLVKEVMRLGDITTIPKQFRNLLAYEA